jgi:hypothetical protein
MKILINSSSPVCLSLRGKHCCPILLATGFEKSVFHVLKKKTVSDMPTLNFVVLLNFKNKNFVSFILLMKAKNELIKLRDVL